MKKLLRNKRLFRWKIKAGAMQYAIGIAVLNLFAIMFFLLYSQFKTKELNNYLIGIQTEELFRSSLVVLEESPQLFTQGSVALDLFPNELPGYSNTVQFLHWGLYRVAKVTIKFKVWEQTKNYLFVDDVFQTTLLPSLYLASPKSYLSVCGNTFLGDNTYLPEYGIKPTTIGGKTFTREKLIQGRSFKASNELPKLTTSLSICYSNIKQLSDSLLPIQLLGSEKTIENSFTNKTACLFSNQLIELNNVSIIGNVKVISNSEIVVESSATVEGAILMAPKITIRSGFKGNAQFFAQNSIVAEADCSFQIPTLFFLNNEEENDKIILGERTSFTGTILIPFPQKTMPLEIEKASQLTGQIYCNGDVLFDGLIFGSLFTRGIVRIDRRGKSMNVLEDVCVDVSRIPKEYGGVSLFDENCKKKCANELF